MVITKIRKQSFFFDGREPPYQGGCREFEPRLSLHLRALDLSSGALLFLEPIRFNHTYTFHIKKAQRFWVQQPPYH